jgi:hypothetical protein
MFVKENGGKETNAENEEGEKFVMNEYMHELANGSIDKFLDVNELETLLPTFPLTDSHADIPTGFKNNVFFVVRNSQNQEKRLKELFLRRLWSVELLHRRYPKDIFLYGRTVETSRMCS